MTQPHPDLDDGSGAVYRFFAGRPMLRHHRADGTYFRRGRRMVAGPPSRWLLRPGYQRQFVRVGVTAAAVGAYAAHLAAPAYADPALTALAALGGARLVRAGRDRWRSRRFRAVYLDPTVGALAERLDRPFELHVSPDLGNLTPRLVGPMSPAERAVRDWYGRRVEPLLRWAPDRAMRGVWAVQAAAKPVTDKLALFRVPREEQGPRIQVTVQAPFLTEDQTKTVSAIVKAKIPAGLDLIERTDQVGGQVTMTWTVRRRPPSLVGFADVIARVDQLPETEFFIGLTASREPLTIDLDDDSPHIAVSAGSGAGKSVLAQLVGAQILRRGGRLFVLDRKGSHRWAKGLPGVTYCLKAADMHAALVGLASLADARNTHDFLETGQPLVLADGTEDDGHRVGIIAEELNATIHQLRRYWAEVRDPGDPVTSPAITALADILQMGRSARMNMIGIAQMLTARAIGGSEARENFVVRFLARYTMNAWRMLCDGVPVPRSSRTRGRWQCVRGGAATEVQVAFLDRAEVRRLAVSPLSPRGRYIASDLGQSPGHAPSGDTSADPMDARVTLRQAVDQGLVDGTFEAAKKRLQRDPNRPKPVGQRGTALLYRAGDLVAWDVKASAA